MIHFTQTYYFVFAALTIIGGIIGYVNKRSTASLVAGGISGALLVVAALFVNTKPTGGLILGLVVSVMLAGRFIPNFMEKKVLFPSGIMSLLSTAGIIVTLLSWYKK
jgi:uncharacterized membrane protein (UPF0136 family)